MARTSPSSIEDDPSVLGAILKRLRIQRGWTLAELANLTQLSKPYLSRLESGQRQPSLAALLTLSRIFETPIRSLLEHETHQPASPVVLQSSGASIQRSNGLRYRAVSGGGAMVNLSAAHVTVPRRRRQAKLARHDGEELLYLLSGTLNLVFEHEIHTLQPGDSAHFDARVPHRLIATGDRDAEVLVVAYVPKLGSENAATTIGSSNSPGLRARNPNQLASVPICASLASG